MFARTACPTQLVRSLAHSLAPNFKGVQNRDAFDSSISQSPIWEGQTDGLTKKRSDDRTDGQIREDGLTPHRYILAR